MYSKTVRKSAKTRNFVTFFVVAIIAAFIMMYEKSDIITPPKSNTRDASPSWIIENAKIRHFDNEGKLSTVIKAKALHYYDSPEHLILDKPEIEQGKVVGKQEWQSSWRSLASTGYSEDISSSISLKGDVNVYNLLNHYHLETEELFIDNTEGHLNTDRKVTVNGPDITLVSNGIEANWFDQKIKLLRDVNVQIDTH